MNSTLILALNAGLLAILAGCLGDGEPVYMYTLRPADDPVDPVVLTPEDARNETLRPLIEMLERAEGNSTYMRVSLGEAEAIGAAVTARAPTKPWSGYVTYEGSSYYVSLLSGH